MTVKILVVDDEVDLETLVVQKFRKQIKEKKFDFVFARNGLEALQKIQADSELNIVLTDLNMPEMDGLTLLDHLFKMDRIVTAVVISAYGDMSNIRNAMNRGAHDFLLKPIDFMDLEMTIHKMIDHYHHQKDALENKMNLRDLEKELDVAKEIQQSMLPRDFQPILSNHNYQLIGKMIPAKHVGGDFFDFFSIGNHKLGLIIADVSGKNISASLFMAISKALIHYIASQSQSAEETIRKTNDLLCYKNDLVMFVTVFYAILDTQTGELKYCNAGHNRPYVISEEGSIQQIGEQSGMAMGVLTCEELDKICPYKEVTLQLKPGDSVVFYTDGVTEAMNSDKELFAESRLKESLTSGRNKTIAQLVQHVLDEMQKFTKGIEQSDDITMMVVSYVPNAGESDRQPEMLEKMYCPLPT